MRNGNSIYTIAQINKMFADVNKHWAKAEIEQMASKLIVKGMIEEVFGPDQRITRAEFAAMITRALGISENKGAVKFNDFSNKNWYAGAVGATVKAGLVVGFEDGSFKPDALITREQMAVMIARALIFAGKPTNATTREEQLLEAFEDRAKINVWVQSAIAQAVDAHIIVGMNGNKFAELYLGLQPYFKKNAEIGI